MRKPAFEPCIPTPGKEVPAGADWIHEVKHDGYRLIIQREGKRVRLFTRNGHDWSDRFPLIVEAALRSRVSSFVIDGEAVLLGVDGRSDFNGLYSRKHNDEVQFYAFDVLMMQAEDYGSFRYISARTTWRGCWNGASMASFFPTSNTVKLGRTSSGMPA
jgi:bifunctional non-homologous end joining protein LigD